MKKKIRELIVVEGRADVTAVKRAVDAEVMSVGGFGVRRKSVLETILYASEKSGVVVLTDPDFAGEQIRQTIEKHVPNIKHAFLVQEEGRREKDGRIGVEYASPESIRKALLLAKYTLQNVEEIFSIVDLIECDLVHHPDAKERRQQVGKILRVGYANAKQFVRRLNHFGITLEAFWEAVDSLPTTDASSAMNPKSGET